jgi:hypothetical protein
MTGSRQFLKTKEENKSSNEKFKENMNKIAKWPNISNKKLRMKTTLTDCEDKTMKLCTDRAKKNNN